MVTNALNERQVPDDGHKNRPKHVVVNIENIQYSS